MNEEQHRKALSRERKRSEAAAELIRACQLAVFDNNTPADRFLATFFKEHRHFGSRDRRFMRAAVFAWFRWCGLLDPQRNLDVSTHMATALWLDGEDEHARLAAAHLDTKLPERKAPLDVRKRLPLLTHLDLPKDDSALKLLFSETLPPQLQPGLWPSLGWQLQTRPPLWIRVRPGFEEDLKIALNGKGLHVLPHPSLSNSWVLSGPIQPGQLPQKLRNAYVIQDLSSQCVGHIAHPKPQENWWDMCAGSGGKALHLADLAKDQLFILATEPRRSALREMNRRTHTLGLKSIRPRIMDAGPNPAQGRTYDGVLVDAPCSGTGTWNRAPDARWRYKQEDPERAAARQIQLLHKAAPHVAPGGHIIYSVCSVTQTETEGIVRRFLERQPTFSLRSFSNPLTGRPTEGSLLIEPQDGPCNGFFVAQFGKRT